MICLGDNLNMSAADQLCSETVAKAEGEFGHIIACLENIVCSVVYIPGNVSELSILSHTASVCACARVPTLCVCVTH